MYQQKIKSPAWELESVNDNYTITFSSRNSGCADFITLPTSVVADKMLKVGLLVKCDRMGHYAEKLQHIDPDIPLHG